MQTSCNLAAMHAPRLALLVALTALLVLPLGACKVSGELKFGAGKADADAGATTSSSDGSATPSTTTTTRQTAIHIVRRGDKLVYEGGEIEFATNSDILRGASTEQIIDEFADVLKRYPELKVRIEGHTDSRGSTSSNQKLSQKRADAIQRALVQRGVASERLSPVGHGENKPSRPEPLLCHNRSEDTVPVERLSECHDTWRSNRRAVFVVTDGADTLPTEGTEVSKPKTITPDDPPAAILLAEPTPAKKKRPDWALRIFGGYSTLPIDAFHGGHLGVGLHASQRFGTRDRGYIGGGPRLHYRGMRFTDSGFGDTKLALHTFGPEGNLLIGGGNKKIVGLFSARLGLGLLAERGTSGLAGDLKRNALGGWALGGVVVLAKLAPRWSLGGHAEVGVLGSTGGGALALLAEIGLNVAWHFGRGRRSGI